MSELALDPVEGVLLVLNEGAATGTNKFGLLLALIDLAPGATMDGVLSVDSLVERLIDIHWEHTRPFLGQAPLQQVTSANRSSTLIQQIEHLQTAVRPNLPFEQALHEIPDATWNKSLAKVRRDVLRNPLARLQNLPGSPPPFLYEILPGEPVSIRFLPGAIEALTRFGPALRPLTENRFIRVVLAANGHSTDQSVEARLEEHFFGAERRMPSLRMRQELWELQGGRCVFTRQMVGDPAVRVRAVALDHVIPWAKYRLSVVENFVLTSASTNSSKKDYLLAPNLLERWVEYLSTKSNDLEQLASRHGWPSDLQRVVTAAEYAYLAASSASPVWSETGAKCLGSVGKDQAVQAMRQLQSAQDNAVEARRPTKG